MADFKPISPFIGLEMPCRLSAELVESMALRERTHLVLEIDEFFKRSKKGVIWGTLYFQIEDGRAFPDEHWTDIVSGFVRAWLAALVRIAGGISSTETVAFYDGPMQIRLNAGEADVMELVFSRRDEPEFKTVVAKTHLLINSVRVAEKLSVACEQRQWNNADTIAVRSSLRGLSGFRS